MVLNRQRRVRVVLAPLLEFCERARRELGFPRESVTIQLLSDPAIARLNRRFRGKRGPTDVLSFPAATRRAKGRSRPRGYLGDIAISPETARRNARRFSRDVPTELRILLLHGMIHLAGYDHESDTGQMERMERRMRRRLGLA